MFVTAAFFVSLIIVVKQHNYIYYKLTTSYTIVHYYVVCSFVYYGGLPTSMDAILATVVDGGRAAIVIDIETVEIN